ncbi:MAG: CRISPR-associated protein Cas4 [Dictyoglomaceae bacterium]|nr:CRISPR-associated protein Cas4 [Dictyoglomaceae bacterium]
MLYLSEMKNINGTLIACYYACKRELWYTAHEILPDQDNNFLELGRLTEESSYEEEGKGFLLGDIKIDLIKKERDTLIIGEIKKSSRSEKTGIMQLYFYIMQLKSKGIIAKGEVLFPKEKRKIQIELTSEIENELNGAMNKIQEIIEQEIPPPRTKIPYCTHCAYKEFCWS